MEAVRPETRKRGGDDDRHQVRLGPEARDADTRQPSLLRSALLPLHRELCAR